VPRTFTAFGAAGRVGEFAFDTEHLTLAEGVAKAGGLIDALADPAGVFLFRFEPERIANALDPNAQVGAQVGGHVRGQRRIPVVYRLNLREASGYFLARSLEMRDKDIILVAEADGVQLLKFLTLLRAVSGIANDARSAATGSTSNSSSSSSSF
jgi:polysaccharide export outer membrane protein